MQAWQQGPPPPGWQQQGPPPGWQQGGWQQQGPLQGWQQVWQGGWQQGPPPGWQQGPLQGWQQGPPPPWQQQQQRWQPQMVEPGVRVVSPPISSGPYNGMPPMAMQPPPAPPSAGVRLQAMQQQPPQVVPGPASAPGYAQSVGPPASGMQQGAPQGQQWGH
ncbi:MAG: hypothetical protein J3K34DRAFT_425382 [Monoraphidium minutum]|nr:MAG: hypothetical protein J3K34DRAFT_425382 [Monoraphidium minutum]